VSTGGFAGRTLLALDTATEWCSVALWRDGLLAERVERAPRGHADLVLRQVAAVLAEARLERHEIDAVACSRGPGGFTGVRVGLSVGIGFALGLQKPLAGISTLATLAWGASQDFGGADWLVALDARMGQVYAAGYHCADAGVDGGRCQLLYPEQVCDPERLELPAISEVGARWQAAGPGFAAYAERIPAAVLTGVNGPPRDCWPQARHVAALAAAGWPESFCARAADLAPVYLRDQVVHQAAAGGTTNR